ncbi:MAG TPA: hypothetical protein PKC67_14445 [Kiritimatiellia bacterium]|nr:hypothetical protein [Kiritimatiellia bacterium]HMP35536.1 hypothetical protein [Kiritimatiellia bacterium]
MIRRLAILLAVAFSVLSPAFAQLSDDHGNDPSRATALNGISNLVSGVFEQRADRDVFSFPVLPQWSYIIRIATSTVWDLRVEVVPPLGTPRMATTNTVHASAPAQMTWTNPGTAGRWFLRVTPMFQFTTGSYQVAVWTVPATNDADGDGIADAWELATFGAITNADASSFRLGPDYSDRDRYLAGLGETGTLAIEAWSGVAGQEVFQWTAAPHARYAVEAASQLAGPWSMLGEQTAGAVDLSLAFTNAAATTTAQYYRIRFAP